MGALLNGPTTDPTFLLTPKPGFEKSPFQISANWLEVDECQSNTF